MFSRNEGSHEKIFQQYNKSAIIFFVAIIHITFIVISYRFYIDRENYRNDKHTELTQYSSKINSRLADAEHTLTGMRDLAEYYLRFPSELSNKIPPLQQDGEYFYLNKSRYNLTSTSQVMTGSITGIGEISSFNSSLKKELIMANALTPALVTAHKSIKEANWLYYISMKKFVNLYPWVPRSIWQYSDHNLTHSLMLKIEAENNRKKPFWSQPYVDSTGKSLYSALGMGVYLNDDMLGALLIDINSAGLYDSLPDISDQDHGYIIVDKNNHVLIHKNNSNIKLSTNTEFSDIAPKNLTQFNYQSLMPLNPISNIEGWILQKQTLPINGWLLLEYHKKSYFYKNINQKYLVIFIGFFLGLLSLLIAVYYMITKAFITPSKKFMQHIENCSAGDPGKIKPSVQWRYWFKIVEDLFGQNRSLLQRLRDQNNELDLRVKEKTQALLYKSEQHQRDYALLRSVMNAIPDYILFDDQQGRLIGCNQTVEKLLLQKEVDILGRQTKQFISHALSETVANSVYADVHSINLQSEQWTVSTADKTYEIYKAPFYGDDNLVDGKSLALGNIILIRDVSQQFEINKALNHAKNQAEEANKIKSQFLANMSHEIRTPINAIQGMCFLLQQSQLNKVQGQYLDNAQTASNTLLFLVDEILDSAKVESGNMSILLARTELESIVSQVIRLNVSAIAGKDLKLNVSIDSEVPLQLNTDTMRLVQVLSNLLNNSIKFTEHGYIDLSISLHSKINEITKAYQPIILFKVKDTGIGIEKSKQKSLFEAFKQADDSMTRMYGGTGLGLSISQHIAQLLHGEITVESSLGEGAEFTLSLPLCNALKTDPKNTLETTLENNEDNEEDNEIFDAGITTLTTHLTGYAFINLSVEIPLSLQQNFSDIKQDITNIDDVNELKRLDITHQKILLLDNVKYQQGLSDIELYIISQMVAIVALCQPITSIISKQLVEQLQSYNIPFLLLEMPLYRHAIVKIAKEINYLKIGFQADKLEEPLQIKQQEMSAESKLQSLPEETLVGMRVLLAEDNMVNQLIATKLLESIHVNVVVANNGQEALDILSREDIDFVFMDIQMPIMDGLTATKHIRAQAKFKYLPIVAMTAHAREEDKQQCLAAGMNLHLTKPFTLDALRESIISMSS